jgi:post-segregation antitoxin (ccd killing protein)
MQRSFSPSSTANAQSLTDARDTSRRIAADAAHSPPALLSLEENQEAIRYWNDYVEKHGLPLADDARL